MEEKLTVTLNIAGRSLRLNINRNEEFVYREAARKLNERLDLFYKKYTTADYPTILTMVAMDRALECEQTSLKTDSTPLASKMTEWSDLIDRVIKE